MGDWSRSCRCRAQSWGWSFPIPAASRDAKVSSHLLDEVEAAVHGGVHLPASGQPCGDRPAAGSPSLSPPSTPWTRRVVRAGIEGSWWQFVLPWLSLTTHFWKSLRPLLIRARTREGKNPPGKAGKAALGRDNITSYNPPALLARFWGGLLCIPGGFHSTFPTPDPPGAGPEPHLRRRSARSGWSNPCRGAPSWWIWCRRCEGQGQRGCQHPRGGSETPPHPRARLLAPRGILQPNERVLGKRGGGPKKAETRGQERWPCHGTAAAISKPIPPPRAAPQAPTPLRTR